MHIQHNPWWLMVEFAGHLELGHKRCLCPVLTKRESFNRNYLTYLVRWNPQNCHAARCSDRFSESKPATESKRIAAEDNILREVEEKATSRSSSKTPGATDCIVASNSGGIMFQCENWYLQMLSQTSSFHMFSGEWSLVCWLANAENSLIGDSVELGAGCRWPEDKKCILCVV
jgi:hypothetical protein